MQAIANTKRLVADGIITSDQASAIEARAREAMVTVSVNVNCVLEYWQRQAAYEA